MAIDSRDKRFSLIGLGLPVPRVLPGPDGSLGNRVDRQQLEFLYSLEVVTFLTGVATVHSPEASGTISSPEASGTVYSPEASGTVKGV